MAQPKTLTRSQVELLRWIGKGCPAGHYEGTHHHISAGALRNRGLVTTSGKGQTWKAKIAKAGSAYLRWVDGPNPPQLRNEPEKPPTPSALQGLSLGIQLAGGALRVPAPSVVHRDAIDWVARARLAERQGLLPLGTWLLVLRHPGEAELRIERAPDDLLVEGAASAG